MNSTLGFFLIGCAWIAIAILCFVATGHMHAIDHAPATRAHALYNVRAARPHRSTPNAIRNI